MITVAPATIAPITGDGSRVSTRFFDPVVTEDVAVSGREGVDVAVLRIERVEQSVP